jgi:hypothetical protein
MLIIPDYLKSPLFMMNSAENPPLLSHAFLHLTKIGGSHGYPRTAIQMLLQIIRM